MDFALLIVVVVTFSIMEQYKYRRVAKNSSELLYKWQSLALSRRYKHSAGDIHDKL